MAEIVKPDMTFVWAVGGAIIAPSNTKIQQGWTAEIPPHQWENWVQNRQDMALLYLMQKGIPEWDATTEYWANRSFVQRSGNLYKAIRNNKNADPLTASADWTSAIPVATTTVQGISARATSAEVITGTNDTKFVTAKTLQDKLASPTTGYLKASNNLSDVANVDIARNNLGIKAATNSAGGLIRIATATESTGRTLDTVALTPAGLNSNIQTSSTDNTTRRILTVGAFGLGSGTVTPPNGRGSLNPMGWYYQSTAVPFGGGSFFLEMPFNSVTGGMRLSNNPYSDRFYFNSWNSSTKEFNPAVEIYHTGNFTPGDYALKNHTHTIAQVTGLQNALDNKQNSIGYVPVNKAGDTMTGSLTLSTGNIRATDGAIYSGGDITAKTGVIVGDIENWAVGSILATNRVQFGNAYNRHAIVKEDSEVGLARYTGTGTWEDWVWKTVGDSVGFTARPTVNGVGVATLDDLTQMGIGSVLFGRVSLFAQGTYPYGSYLSGQHIHSSSVHRNLYDSVIGVGTWKCVGYARVGIGAQAPEEAITVWARVS